MEEAVVSSDETALCDEVKASAVYGTVTGEIHPNALDDPNDPNDPNAPNNPNA